MSHWIISGILVSCVINCKVFDSDVFDKYILLLGIIVYIKALLIINVFETVTNV